MIDPYEGIIFQYRTEEELSRQEEIEARQNALFDRNSASTEAYNYWRNDKPEEVDEYFSLEEESFNIKQRILDRYKAHTTPKQVLADIEKVVNSITQDDFKLELHRREEFYLTAIALGVEESILTPLTEYTRESFENCYTFIFLRLNPLITALNGNNARIDKVTAIIEKRIALWYVKSQPAYLAIAHGKITDAFSMMNSRMAETDKITGTAIIEKMGVQLAIANFAKMRATLGISTDKLLSYAIAKFTEKNDFRHTKTKEPKREVTFSLKEYADKLGYQVYEKDTSTPEEAERERKRAKNQLDNARKAIKKDLDLLHASTLKWEEIINGKPRDFERVSIVTYTGVINGEVRISFSPEIASYLAERNLLSQYPTALLGLDGRNPTPYYIGKKLAEHYNMDSNITRGTNDRLGIPSILAVTDLPTYEYVQKTDRGHWENRIKEPLERALDELQRIGLLTEWEYTHSKGVKLTDEEAQEITSYSEWAKLYLHFKLANEIDHSERIQAKKEAREQAREKAKKSRAKKKTTKES